MSSVGLHGQLEVNSKVKVKTGNSTTDAVVLEKGPKTVYKVTYDGWSNIYDEYVIPENCNDAQTGESITADRKVNNGDKVQVAWVDGSSYVGTVIAKETAVACIRPDAYPKEYRIWITADDLVGDYQISGSSRDTFEIGSQVNVKLMNGSVVKAPVTKKGPVPVIYVTYDGWSKVYDEYVEIGQCRSSKTGATIANVSEVNTNERLKVQWLDGGCYEGTVLGISTALARVVPAGYPKEYELWITEKELILDESVTNSNQQAGNAYESVLQSAMNDVMKHIENFQQEAIQIKRKDEAPQRKVPPIPTHDKKDSTKWKKLLSKNLMSDATIKKLEKKASGVKKRVWSGKSIVENEYHVAIGASKDDIEFAQLVENALINRGLKVTTNQDNLHNSRTFLLIYSDTVNMDENIIRHLTRAAERYDMGETTIVALVRPGCPEEVIDHIPDRVAYSLSNVVFFHYDWFGELAAHARRQTINDLVSLIRNNVNDSHEYDLSGTWLCQAIITSTITSYSTSRDFTLLLKQRGTKIMGRTVDNFKVEGDVQKNIVKLRLTYRGEYKQNLESWEEDDYFFIAEIVAFITNQGYRLEGEYVEETDCGTAGNNAALKYNRSFGPFNGTLERQCLSGYYNAHWYSAPEEIETIAVIHRGGNEILAQFPNEFGSTTVGFLDLSSSTLHLNSCSNRNMTRTLIGKLVKDSEGACAFQCLGYASEFGLAGVPESIALTRDPVHIVRPVSDDDDGLLEEMHQSVARRLKGIPFTPGSYHPLEKDEFPVVIFCTEHERKKAENLKMELESVQEIMPVSITSSDWKKSRTIVLLLSKFTQTDRDLIDAIEEAAEQEIPIFNVGLDSWFSIFGSDNWKDQSLRLKLMNALARLNQTPATTLDPSHSNFRGLIKGIRKKIDPPRFALIGLFGVEVLGSNPPEKITKYSDIEDESIQMIKRPLMMYLYFEPSSTKLQMGTDYIVQGLTGEIDPETFTLKMSNDAGSYDLRMNSDMDKLYGKYWSKRASKEYTILATKAETGISGFYAMGGEQAPTGIVQLGKKTADIMFGGYTLPAVISNSKLIFNAPYPGRKEILLTYAAQIVLKPEGNYLYGFSYQSEASTPRNVFDAKQYAGGSLKVSKGKKIEEEKAEEWLVNLIEEFWGAMDIGDYDALLQISKDDMITAFPKASFDKSVVEHRRSLGKYISKSAVYIGKKAQVTMGKSVGATRFDFKFDFEKCKKVDYSIMIMDADKKLNGIQSYEEEAELMNSSQYDVMISYKSWDARWVDMLQLFLERNGYSVWRDRRMDVGANWSEDITKAVRKSGCVVAAISENYLSSVLCTKEVRMAHDISKPVIPLILPETCPKKNPAEKLVSASYKESHLPITIANELSDITWIDFRPLQNLNQPDPSDAESFQKKYGSCLESLLRTLEELSNHKRVVDLQGDWSVAIGDGNEQDKLKLSILSTIGTNVEGVMTSSKLGNADIPLDKNVSICHGSNVHIVGHYRGNSKAVSYTIDGRVAGDGNSFAGICRIHKTPWEHPDGQQVNPLVSGLSHYSTTNDCAVYTVKGVRDEPLQSIASDQYAKEEFVLDMERAYDIVKDAFGDVKREALEMSIVSYKEAFEKYDTDGNHELDMNELELALRVASMNCSQDEKLSIMKELDQNRNGTIDFYEFLEYIAKVKLSKVKQNTPAARVVKEGLVSKACSVQ